MDQPAHAQDSRARVVHRGPQEAERTTGAECSESRCRERQAGEAVERPGEGEGDGVNVVQPDSANPIFIKNSSEPAPPLLPGARATAVHGSTLWNQFFETLGRAKTPPFFFLAFPPDCITRRSVGAQRACVAYAHALSQPPQAICPEATA